MERHGYWNKILHVSLSDRRTWIEEPGDEFFRRYAGGRGLIAHYLLEYVPKGADDLKAAVEAWLDSAKKRGVVKQLLDKWKLEGAEPA